MSKMTFCISTLNNNNYLQLAIKSVRENSHFKDAPFVIYAENCTDGTNEWLYVVEFPKRQLTAVIDRKSIQIRKLEGAL